MQGMEDAVGQLPQDPQTALVRFAEWVESRRRNSSPSVEGYIRVKLFYATFIKRYNIQLDITEALSISTPEKSVATIQQLVFAARERLLEDGIEASVSDLLDQYESKVGLNSFGFAKLNDDEKRKIHANINKIRVIVNESAISDRKKNALYGKLDDLASEVDRIGTRTDQFFAFMGDVAFVMGDMATKAKPLLDEVKDMIKTVGRARARQEGVSLPPGDTPLSLPAPDEE